MNGLTSSQWVPHLSVVIPVYNELATIRQVLLRVIGAVPQVSKQIVIVDDFSNDGTREWLQLNLTAAEGIWFQLSVGDKGELNFSRENDQDVSGFSFTTLFHDRNKGKGAALKTGFSHTIGDVIVIQDADLEYDPSDWHRMLELIVERKAADVVYGSRFFGRPHRSLYYHHYIGNRIISIAFNILYNQMLSDIEVCYKMFTREVLNSLALTSEGFGIEVEISAQVALARCWRIYEVGISYFGRTYDEGKKIGWRDGVKALAFLVKFRVRRPRSKRARLEA